MRRKGNLQQKIMVGFLSMMLVIGMVMETTPVEIQAEENTGIVESVSESTTESIAEETVTESETEPETITGEAQRQATTAVPYTYTINADRTAATITKYTGSESVISIPPEVNGIPVTAIGDKAFYECSSLTSIMIPDSVTSIGEWVFYGCKGLTSITIPLGVTNIGEWAFAWCESLTSVTIPSGVTSIGNQAFYCCSALQSITIPSDSRMESIGGSAFEGCIGLQSITIPDSVKSIGNCTFTGCRNLTSVTIPSGVTSIGNMAFAWCDSLTSVTIPFGVTIIGDGAFEECRNLTSVTIPSSMTGIGNDAFVGCRNLATVTVKAEDPSKITIGFGVFSHCDNLITITVPEGKKEAYQTAEGWKQWKDYIQEEGHTFSTDWSKDAENHWHEATCKHAGVVVSDEAAHSFGEWTVTKKATTSAKGSKKRSCTVCGYEQTEEIPMKAPEPTSIGKIETTKEQGENVPATNFATPEKDLIGAVLTEEEQSLVKAGTDIKIILDIDNMDASVSQSDKQAVTAKADGYNVGQYLDINLYKIINENKENKEKITQTNGKIKIVIVVPEAVKNTDSKKTRSYAVVRVHNGVADLLTDLDNDESTITIETDRFSTYALVYKDSAGSNKNNQTTATDKNLSPATGDDTPIEMCVVLIMLAGISYLTLFCVNRKKNIL